MLVPNRHGSSNSYRYGFNGQEKDDEISGEGNSYTAEFWQYDPRVARRWNIDPVVVHWESSYAVFRNNPIAYSDPNGDSPGGGSEDDLVKANKTAQDVYKKHGTKSIDQVFVGFTIDADKNKQASVQKELKNAAIQHTGVTPKERPVPIGMYDSTYHARLSEYAAWANSDDGKKFNGYLSLLTQVYNDIGTLDFAQKSVGDEFNAIISATNDTGLKAKAIVARNEYATDYRTRMGLINEGINTIITAASIVSIPTSFSAQPTTFYRAMSTAEYNALVNANGLTYMKGKELFVSSSLSYSKSYLSKPGYDVIVQFTMKPSAMKHFNQVSVIHRTKAASSGWAERGHLMWKSEKGALNLGIQQNTGIFNSQIQSFKVIK
jgi:RHS repeat-associated protein